MKNSIKNLKTYNKNAFKSVFFSVQKIDIIKYI